MGNGLAPLLAEQFTSERRHISEGGTQCLLPKPNRINRRTNSRKAKSGKRVRTNAALITLATIPETRAKTRVRRTRSGRISNPKSPSNCFDRFSSLPFRIEREGSSQPAYFASHAAGLNFAPSFSILKCVLVTKS